MYFAVAGIFEKLQLLKEEVPETVSPVEGHPSSGHIFWIMSGILGNILPRPYDMVRNPCRQETVLNLIESLKQ